MVTNEVAGPLYSLWKSAMHLSTFTNYAIWAGFSHIFTIAEGLSSLYYADVALADEKSRFLAGRNRRDIIML